VIRLSPLLAIVPLLSQFLDYQDAMSKPVMNQVQPSTSRFLPIDGVVNFRDLGGYQTENGRQVKWGKVFRAGQLDRPSEQGVQSLQDLQIATVVDLRFNEETRGFPTNRQALPKADIIEWQDYYQLEEQAEDSAEEIKMSWRQALDTGDAEQVREAMRVNYPVKLYSHKGIYRAMLDRLIAGETPLIFHCAAGKDRTGVGAALILGLLGVSRDDIIEDYLLTQQEVHKLLDHFRAAGAANADEFSDLQNRLRQYPSDVIAPVFEANPSYIETLLNYVEQTYQGFANYAEQVLAFNADQQQSLKDALLVRQA